MDHYELIRRKHLIDGLSVRAISRELGHSRKTIRKVLAHGTPPGYQRHQPVVSPVMDKVARLIDQADLCCAEAARVLGIGPMLAIHAYKFAKHSLRSTQADPDRRNLDDTFRRTQGPEVARRRDELNEPFHVIAAAMGVTRETARKAYVRHHRQVAEQTGDTERLKDLGKSRGMSLTKLWRVREMLKAGHSVNEVVAEVGCSKSMIYGEKRKL